MSGVEGEGVAAGEGEAVAEAPPAPATSTSPAPASSESPSPFATASLTLVQGGKIPLREYAVAYLRHHDVLQESSRSDDRARRLAFLAMSDALKVSPAKVKFCLPLFRKKFYQCVVECVQAAGGQRDALRQRAPYWVQLVDMKLNMLPKALEEVSLHRKRRLKKARKLTPGGALRLIVAYCQRHRALCSSALYSELRQALRCRTGLSELHAVWVSAQRVCVQQLAALCRAGDAPGAGGEPLSPVAWRVANLVLTYTDVDTHRILTDESVTLYDELQALTTLFTLVQKHSVENSLGTVVAELLPCRWTAIYREYTASGKVTSIVVLQRRWHELKLQTRSRLVQYWRDRSAQPAPALLHVDIAKRYPHVVRGAAASWRQLVADGLVIQEPLEDSPPRAVSAGEAAQDSPADDFQDDDVQLIEKQVVTIDVDSASDTEATDNKTAKTIPMKEQRQNSNASIKEEKKDNEISISLHQIIVPTLIRQLINVASVESINNRYRESVTRQSIDNAPANEVPNNSATPSTSAPKNIDTDQTLAILQTLDPSKVRTEIIFESDSDDDTLDKQSYNVSNNDQNTNELPIVITNVISKADVVNLTKNVENINNISKKVSNTSLNDVTMTNDDTSDVAQQLDGPNSHSGNKTIENSVVELNLHNKNNDTTSGHGENGENTHVSADTDISNITEDVNGQKDSGNSTIATTVNSDVSVTDKLPKSNPEDITMQDIAANNNKTDTTEVIVPNSESRNDTSIARDENNESEINADTNINSGTGVGVTNSQPLTIDSEIGIPVNAISANSVTDVTLGTLVNNGDTIRNGVNNTNNSDSENGMSEIKDINNDVISEPNSIFRSGSDQEDDEKERETNLVDPKLIMETRVELIKVHDIDAWTKHSKHGRYIDINKLDVASLQPTQNNKKPLIEIKVNGIDKIINTAYSDTAENSDTELLEARRDDKMNVTSDSSDDEQIDNELSAENSNMSTTDSADDMFLPNEDDSMSSDDSSGDEVALSQFKRVRGAKHSLASDVMEWTDDYDTVYNGGVKRKDRGLRKSERVAKRVQLPDIEEVRRVNSNILTAQVAPITAITAGDSIFDVEDSSFNTVGDKLVHQSVSAETPANQSFSGNKPDDQSVNQDQARGVVMPTDQSESADKPTDNACDKEEWPDGNVPTRRELNIVLKKLSSQLRRSGLVCGVPAPAYCCAARRQRSVNDARRRICAQAPEIQIHVHGASGCDCCCRHLLQGAEQRARLHEDASRLKRDLRRMLYSGAALGAAAAAAARAATPTPTTATDTATATATATHNHTPPPASNSSSKQNTSSPKPANNSSFKKKRKSRSKKKSKDDDKPTEDTPNPDPLAEWERQKTLHAQYFHISPNTNRKRRRDPTEKDDNADRTPTNTEPIDVDTVQESSDTIEISNGTESNSNVIDITEDSNDSDKLQIQETQVDLQNETLTECVPNKVMKLSSDTMKPFSLVVTELKDPQCQYRRVVKLHTNHNTKLNIRLKPIITSVASLSDLKTSRASGNISMPSAANVINVAGKLYDLPSGVASVAAVPGQLVRLPTSRPRILKTVQSSAANVFNVPSKIVRVASAPIVSTVPGKLISVPYSERVTASTGKLDPLPSNASSVNSVAGNSISLPSNSTSVSSVAGKSISLPNNATSVSSVAGNLISLPSNTTSVNSVTGNLISLPSNATSGSSVAGNLISLPSNTTSVNSVTGNLISLPSNATSGSSVAGNLISLPSNATSGSSVAGNLISLPSNATSGSSVAGNLISLPSNATSGSSVAGNLISLQSNATNVSTVAGNIISLPSKTTSVNSVAGSLISLLSNTTSVNSVAGNLVSLPSNATNVSSVAGNLISLPSNATSVSSVACAGEVTACGPADDVNTGM